MATKQIAWNTGSGNITLTYTGQGDGPFSVVSDPNDTGSARSKTITIETTRGGLITKNVTVSQAACPFPVGDVKNFAYTGDVQSILLPAGSYKLQCWGAEGGTETYSGNAGGKGGYSEGVLTLSQNTTVYIFVGGKGNNYPGAGNGGWNCGGGGTGLSNYGYSGVYGWTHMGCGGGATDIALTTSSMNYSSYRNNRSTASLLSRMIVAGGGSGGAYGQQEYTHDVETFVTTIQMTYSHYSSGLQKYIYYAPGGSTNDVTQYGITWGKKYKLVLSNSSIPGNVHYFTQYTSSNAFISQQATSNNIITIDAKASNAAYISLNAMISTQVSNYTINVYEVSETTDITYQALVGYAGGGVNGKGYNSSYYGRQNGAGANGAFGMGANQQATNKRFHGGLGGAGWYGGGTIADNDRLDWVTVSGGGSGFVNTYENRSYRPSGYTGLQLDSGETKDGTQTFKSPSGSNETGHSGNGYARITRLS